MNMVKEAPKDGTNRNECPPPEKLLDFYRNRVSRRIKKKIVKHVVNCVACLDESRVIRDTLAGEKFLINEIGDMVGINIGRSTSRIIYNQRRLHWLIAGGATVVVTLLLAVFLVYKSKESSYNNQLRGYIAEILTIEPSGEFRLSKWNGFRWKGIKGVEYYVVSVFDESLKIVWKSDKVRNENLFPSVEINDILRKGKSFSWQVVGSFSDGRTAKSKPIEITVH